MLNVERSRNSFINEKINPIKGVCEINTNFKQVLLLGLFDPTKRQFTKSQLITTRLKSFN